jgi:hypothetical protein
MFSGLEPRKYEQHSQSLSFGRVRNRTIYDASTAETGEGRSSANSSSVKQTILLSFEGWI